MGLSFLSSKAQCEFVLLLWTLANNHLQCTCWITIQLHKFFPCVKLNPHYFPFPLRATVFSKSICSVHIRENADSFLREETFLLTCEQFYNRSRWLWLCRLPRCCGWQRRSRRAEQSAGQPRPAGSEGRQRCSRSVYWRMGFAYYLFHLRVLQMSWIAIQQRRRATEAVPSVGKVTVVTASAYPDLTQKQCTAQFWMARILPHSSSPLYSPQSSAHCTCQRLLSAPKIFLKRLQLHEHYGCPLSFFSLQNLRCLLFSWKPHSPLVCDFPPDTSWTLFACTMFHLHRHPHARWVYSFPALTHLAIASCSCLSAVHHQFFFHQGVSRPMLWMKQLTTVLFNKFSNFLTLKAPRTGRSIKLDSLYLNCSVAVLLYSALSLLTGCIFFNTIQTFHIKPWKK